MTRGILAVILAIITAAAAFYFYHAAESALQTAPSAPTASPSGTATATAPNAPAATAVTTTVPPAGSGTKNQPAQPPASYEANYSHRITVNVADTAIYLTGWSVEGVGEGNYSMGKFTIDMPMHSPLQLAYWAVSEGGFFRVLTCLGADCRVEEIKTPPSDLLKSGVNVTRISSGECSYLGLRGVTVDEKGAISAEALSSILAGLPANGTGTYTARYCTAGGIRLYLEGDIHLSITLYGQHLTVNIHVESKATEIGPYNASRYDEILRRVKLGQSNNLTSAGQ